MQNSHLHNLNPAQREAVEHKDGPLMIIAGAGAGKTRVITHRIVHLVKNGVAPEEILAVTFTNKAAKEMRERVHALLGSDADLNRPVSVFGAGSAMPFVATFHALCVFILRENARILGLTRHFTIFDRDDSKRAVKKAIESIGEDPKQLEPRTVLSAISLAKGQAYTPEEFAQENSLNPWKQTIARVWERYDAFLREEGALDFDDLLVRALALLREHPEVLSKYRARWKYLHIDEYQDTNKIQYELARILAAPDNNICVVGDHDQNVYSWRGSDLQNLLDFEDEFAGAKTILLEQNYRSTQTILTAANQVISKNTRRKEKNLFTENGGGDRVVVYGASGAEDEARFVVERSQELIESGVPAREIAVLYRANFQSRALEEAFLYSGTPYQVLGTKFFDRKEVKDTLSYIRAALNTENRVDVTRIIATPPRGIGKVTLTKMLEGKDSELTGATAKKVQEFRTLLAHISEYALTHKVSETIKMVVKESGLEKLYMNSGEDGLERLENVKELASLATKYDALEHGEGIEKLLEDAALATDQDSLEKNENAVKLMTVHAAKGLEFDYVFVTGLEEGLFPHERLGEEKEDDEEERRLFYVALTRARKQVFLTHALVRTIFGSQTIQTPSQFIEDIDENLLHFEQSEYSRWRGENEGKVDLIDF